MPTWQWGQRAAPGVILGVVAPHRRVAATHQMPHLGNIRTVTRNMPVAVSDEMRPSGGGAVLPATFVLAGLGF